MRDKQLLLAVLAQLEREKSVSIPQLAQLLATSEENIYDALETLVFAYDAASIRLDLHDTYAVLETRGTNRMLRLTLTEADVLVDALTGAGFSADDALVSTLIETKGLLDASSLAREPRMQTIGVKDGTEIAQIVAAACEDEGHHLLEIDYRGEDDGSARKRIVEPNSIFSRERHRYLQAFCREAHGWRSFRLDRIEDAHVLDESFAPRDDVPAIPPSISRGDIKALVRFEAVCPLPQWAGMHGVRTLGDGSRTAKIAWTGSSWLPRHVVALMGKAIPLEPPEFVAACREVAEELVGGGA